MPVLSKLCASDLALIALGVAVGASCYFYTKQTTSQPYRFDRTVIEQFNSTEHIPGIQGLRNPNILCFMNCILQAFASSDMLIDWLEHIYEHTGHRSALHGELLLICKSLNTKRASNPLDASVLLRYVGQKMNFAEMEQHDAFEFMVALQECLEIYLKRAGWRVFEASCAKIAANPKSYKPEELGRASYGGPYYGTPLGFLPRDMMPRPNPMQGFDITRLDCSKCKFSVRSHVPFTYLSLPIVGLSLSNCMASYFALEELNQFKCEQCSTVGIAQKKTWIYLLPPVLFIHFRRIVYSNGELFINPKRLTFPFYLLMDSFLYHRPRRGMPMKTYNLVAVIVHVGTVHSGHYYTLRADKTTGQWYQVSDLNCTPVSEKEVQAATAYMLVYERALPRPQ